MKAEEGLGAREKEAWRLSKGEVMVADTAAMWEGHVAGRRIGCKASEPA